MSTFIAKDMRGNWRATTRHSLTDKLVLLVSTYRDYSKDVVTSASVATFDGTFETHAARNDYFKAIQRTHPARVTSKTIEGQHNAALDPAVFDEILTAAKLHYSL